MLFDSDSSFDKGLFTFYRQQAEQQEQLAQQKLKQQSNLNKDKFLTKIVEETNQARNKNSKKNREKSPKYEIKKTLKDLTLKKQVGNTVLVIENPSIKEKLKRQKENNGRYHGYEGYFIKEKSLNLLGQGQLSDNLDIYFQSHRGKVKINRNFSLGQKTHLRHLDRYAQVKDDKYQHAMSDRKPRGLKKVNMLPQINLSPVKTSSYPLQEQKRKKIPPRILNAILKSQTHNWLKQTTKVGQVQGDPHRRLSHSPSYIQFNRFGTDKELSRQYSEEDSFLYQHHSARLNEKQRRLICLLQKFKR